MVVSYLAICTIITRVFFSIFDIKNSANLRKKKFKISQINFLQNPFF